MVVEQLAATWTSPKRQGKFLPDNNRSRRVAAIARLISVGFRSKLSAID
jgi:hypothetical protein